jgi:dolichyl-diphosphooligosaccharide--protein glycosyltransferase/undecaprenyl-diphosphooligosaccharide--protein glycosyltransferase
MEEKSGGGVEKMEKGQLTGQTQAGGGEMERGGKGGEGKTLWLLIGVAYIFSLLFHLYTLHFLVGMEQFYWNGVPLSNNPDGYFFGAGSQKILYGLHQFNPRLANPWHYGLMVLGAGLVKFFPFLNLDQLMLYLPPIISSLVVIPIILIGRLYGRIEWGFLASLVASIGWSYYNRTLLGYYDTDMFSAMLPMFILYFLLKGLREENLSAFFAGGVTIALYPYFYDQGYSIIYAIGLITILYLFLKYRFQNPFVYQVIIYLALGMLGGVPWWIKVGLLLLFHYGVMGSSLRERIDQIGVKSWGIIAFALLLLSLYTGNMVGVILHKVLGYTSTEIGVKGLKFLNVNETVREASQIPLWLVFNRIIGSSIGIIFAILGYILLVWRWREFIIALPLWGIGFFSIVGGLRFTVYAVPIAGLSGVYFFLWLGEKLFSRPQSRLVTGLAGTLLLLLPNITHIIGCCEKNPKLINGMMKIYPLPDVPYFSEPLFTNKEIGVLHKISQISSPKDYGITWWDYGYYIWYYSNINTLIDGGKHNEDNYIVSKILLTHNPYLTANLSRLAVETYIKSGYKKVTDTLFYKNGKPIDVEAFLEKVGSPDYTPPKKSVDVYLIFPEKMTNIYSAISMFSDRNLKSGESFAGGRTLIPVPLRELPTGEIIVGGNGLVDLKNGQLLLVNPKGEVVKRVPLKRVAILGKEPQIAQYPHSGLNLLLSGTLRRGWLMDDYYYLSQGVQMGLLKKYDPNLFELVIDNPRMRVYKLKR